MSVRPIEALAASAAESWSSELPDLEMAELVLAALALLLAVLLAPAVPDCVPLTLIPVEALPLAVTLFVPATFAPLASVLLVDVPLFTDVALLALLFVDFPLLEAVAQDERPLADEVALLFDALSQPDIRSDELLELLPNIDVLSEPRLNFELCIANRKRAMALLLMLGALPVIT